MPDAGKLLLRIIWDGNVVLGVEVKSTRPKAYRLLKGRLPDNAVQLVPLLYSVCGKAQQAAAFAAVSAAQGLAWPENKIFERGVVCEAPSSTASSLNSRRWTLSSSRARVAARARAAAEAGAGARA